MLQRLCCAIVVMGFWPRACEADAPKPGFTTNYGEWSVMSAPAKSAYAAGAFDALTLAGGSVEDRADARGLSACAIEDGFTPNVLAHLVDARYAAHPEERSIGAASVVAAAVTDACEDQMNADRRQSGILPMPPKATTPPK